MARGLPAAPARTPQRSARLSAHATRLSQIAPFCSLVNGFLVKVSQKAIREIGGQSRPSGLRFRGSWSSLYTTILYKLLSPVTLALLGIHAGVEIRRSITIS